MTLTQGLLALAAVVLFALLAHGVWVSWRVRPRRAEPPAARLEPSLDALGWIRTPMKPPPIPWVSRERRRLCLTVEAAPSWLAIASPVSTR